MTTAPTTINPKFMEVLARVNTEGSFQTTFEQLLRQLEGVVAAARLPALVAAFAEIGLMFHPSAEEGGFETPRIVSPRRKKAVAVAAQGSSGCSLLPQAASFCPGRDKKLPIAL